jgi:hypothetical protein
MLPVLYLKKNHSDNKNVAASPHREQLMTERLRLGSIITPHSHSFELPRLMAINVDQWTKKTCNAKLISEGLS